GKAEDRRLDILEVWIESSDDLPRRRLHRRIVEGGSSGQLAAEEDVRRRIEVVRKGQRLVDRFDAERLRVARVPDRDRLTVHQDLPGVGGARSRERAHERGLSGAVTADDADHLARVKDRKSTRLNS